MVRFNLSEKNIIILVISFNPLHCFRASVKNPLTLTSLVFVSFANSYGLSIAKYISAFKLPVLLTNLFARFNPILSVASNIISHFGIPPLCQVLDTYFFKFPIHFFTSILTSTLDFSIDY